MAHYPASDEVMRQRAVAMVVTLTANTSLAPQRYERQLLARYAAGTLTIDEMTDLLDHSTYHVLYRSWAAPSLVATDVQNIVDYSRHRNAQDQVTGLLLYSNRQFVQLIEGGREQIQDLYSRIQQDARHQQVVTISEGPAPQRWFGDWRMAYGEVEKLELTQVLRVMEQQGPALLPVEDPHLQTLLQAFGLPDSK